MFASLFVPFSTGSKFSLKFLSFISLCILVVAWLVAPESSGIPTLSSIGSAWNLMALQQGLLFELWTSAVVIWKALIISAIISCGIAYLTTADGFKSIGTFVSSMRFLGFAGLTYIFTLWTHDDSQLKLALLTFGMTVFLTRSTVDVVKSVPQSDIDYGKSLGLTRWRLTWEVIIRGKLAEMLDLIRQNAAMGWTILTMVEGLVRAQGGIGTLLLNQNKSLNLSAVFAIQLTILAYGILQDIALNYFRFTVCPWSRLNRSA